MRVLSVATFVVGLVVGGAIGPIAIGSETVGSASRSSQGRHVTGIGGVFFKADDPDALRAWYRHHLGIESGPHGTDFLWRDREDPDRLGRTVWTIFPEETGYFGPGDQEVMINYRVRDLDALLEELRSAGVEQTGNVEEYEYGKFAWVLDGEGNRVELWEPGERSAVDLERRIGLRRNAEPGSDT